MCTDNGVLVQATGESLLGFCSRTVCYHLAIFHTRAHTLPWTEYGLNAPRLVGLHVYILMPWSNRRWLSVRDTKLTLANERVSWSLVGQTEARDHLGRPVLGLEISTFLPVFDQCYSWSDTTLKANRLTSIYVIFVFLFICDGWRVCFVWQCCAPPPTRCDVWCVREMDAPYLRNR